MNKRDFHVPTSPVPRIEDILHAHESKLFIYSTKNCRYSRKISTDTKNRAFNVDNRGIEPVQSGTKKGRTNPGLAGVEKITSIWESTG